MLKNQCLLIDIPLALVSKLDKYQTAEKAIILRVFFLQQGPWRQRPAI
jgi:hypothetical protein